MRHKRCNPRLELADPIWVARLFAAANFNTDVELTEAGVILDAIAASDYRRAKTLMDRFARPEFGSALAYYTRKQFTALLSKVPFTGDSSSRKRTALSDFMSAERRCKRTNRRLRHFDKHWNRLPDHLRVIFTRARSEIYRALGTLTEGKLRRIISASRPGSGVSVGTRNRFRVSLPYKLGDTDLAVTDSALIYAEMMVAGSPIWSSLHMEVDWKSGTYTLPFVRANGNRITFVPKDARTLRTIAIEPALNVCLQLGVHSFMADRLATLGNPIDDQGRNQEWARSGSLREFGSSYSTIDLSQASDSVSTELVRWLLPSDWFGFLDDLRCKVGVVEGAPMLYEKFSSMGNGFTFALETLIFWALGKAVSSYTDCHGVVSVYGDDIVVEDRAALLMIEVLQFAGLVVNTTKSYVLGPFRESCGADWHCGLRVTPQYVKKAVFRCTDVYNLLNRADPVFEWGPVRDYLLAVHRKKEPVLFGLENEDTSSCLFAPFDYVKGSGQLKWKSEWQTWTFPVWVFKPESEHVPPLSAYAASLKGSSGSDARGQLRGRGVYRLERRSPGVTRGLPRISRE